MARSHDAYAVVGGQVHRTRAGADRNVRTRNTPLSRPLIRARPVRSFIGLKQTDSQTGCRRSPDHAGLWRRNVSKRASACLHPEWPCCRSGLSACPVHRRSRSRGACRSSQYRSGVADHSGLGRLRSERLAWPWGHCANTPYYGPLPNGLLPARAASGLRLP